MLSAMDVISMQVRTAAVIWTLGTRFSVELLKSIKAAIDLRRNSIKTRF